MLSGYNKQAVNLITIKLNTMRKLRYSDPYRTDARFNSICTGCGKTITKGTPIVYVPNEKKAYHIDCDGGIMRGLQAERSMDQYGTDIY